MSNQPWAIPVSPKQQEVIAERRRYALVDGPRLSGKTLSCLHAVAFELWNTPGAEGMMLGKTVDKNLNGGPWQQLQEYIIPLWIKGDFGFEVITPQRMEAVTHRYYIETTNQQMVNDGGGKPSKLYLDSLMTEADVEAKFKGKNFSLIYWTEISDYFERDTFEALTETFRCLHLRPDQHRLICDTNPPDTGKRSWIWKLWYWFRTVDIDRMDEDVAKQVMPPDFLDSSPEEQAKMIKFAKELQSELALHHFTIDDNEFISDARKQAQRIKYSFNKNLYSRYYLGDYVESDGDGVFSEVWKPQIHVVGDAPDSNREESSLEMLLPSEDCFELLSSWDIGGKNTAAVIMEKIMGKDAEGRERPEFSIMDELVILGEQRRLSLIVEEFEEKMDFWEKVLKRQHNTAWRHWSDRSSIDVYNSISDRTEQVEIMRVSDGRINLLGAHKGAHSVEKRVNHIRKLLFEDRIHVNAARCPHVIKMFDSLKRKRDGKLDKASPFKHAFDAMSYGICMECYSELVDWNYSPRSGSTDGGIISTKL